MLYNISCKYKEMRKAVPNSEQHLAVRTNFADERCQMDVAKILVELRQEREQIEEAIMSLERLARSRGKRRGRPPAWMTEVKRRGRPPGSKNKPKAEKAGAASA